MHTDGATANPVNVSYVAPGNDQPYTFTFRADVFHSGKISAIKAGSDKDSVVVKSSDNGCQAQVSDSWWVTNMIWSDVQAYWQLRDNHCTVM